MKTFCKLLLATALSLPALYVTAQDSWDSYTRNRSKYPVVSPLKGKMVTHFVGLQADIDLVANKRWGYVLIKAGFRKDEKTGATKCFEAVFAKPDASISPSKISVELIAFDIRKPGIPLATYQAVFHNLQIDLEKKTVRCQIPVSITLTGEYMAFVLVAKPPYINLGATEYKKIGERQLFNGPWDENEKASVFIYNPVPGVKDYEDEPMESTTASSPSTQPVQQALPAGYQYNDFGFAVTANQLYWSKRGSNYARSFFENGKYGMKASDGTVLISAQYDDIHFEYSGFMIASKDGKKGVINEANQVVIPFQYERLDLLYKNTASQIPKGVPLDDLRLIAYQDQNHVGIINGRGAIIFPFRESRMAQVYHFYEAPRNAQGYILSVPADYRKLVKETALIFRFDGAGAVNGNGEIILPFEYKDIQPNYETVRPEWVQVEKEGKTGLFDLRGKWLIQPRFTSDITLLHEPRSDDAPIFPSMLTAIEAVETGDEYVTSLAKAGIMDSLGRSILPFEYDGFGMTFQWQGKRHFWAEKIGKWGLVNIDNQVVIPFEHSKIIKKIVLNHEPFFWVKDAAGQYFGLLSMKNKMVVPFKYKWFGESNGDLLEFTDDKGLSGLLNARGEEVLKAGYDRFAVLKGGYFQCVKGTLSGLVSPEGKLLTELTYRNIYAENLLETYASLFKTKGIAESNVITVLETADASFAYLKSGQLVKLN